MALLKGGTVVNGTITGTLIGNADTATAIKQNVIAASTNLNTLTDSGYYTATAEVAATCTNCPVTTDFCMKVDKISDSIVMQTVYGAISNGIVPIYMRSSVSSAFTRVSGE